MSFTDAFDETLSDGIKQISETIHSIDMKFVDVISYNDIWNVANDFSIRLGTKEMAGFLRKRTCFYWENSSLSGWKIFLKLGYKENRTLHSR